MDTQWECQPEAEKLVLDLLSEAKSKNHFLQKLEEDLFTQTSTRLFDWVDYCVAHTDPALVETMKEVGYEALEDNFYYHPGAQLPRIFLESDLHKPSGVALVVDSIDDFILAHGGTKVPIDGTYFGNFRRCQFSLEQGVALWVIERRGTDSIEPTYEGPKTILDYFKALETWCSRPRNLPNEKAALEESIAIALQIVNLLGKDRAAWTILEVERRYWQSKNRAGQVQKSRQDRLGMGWGNHDHHTFRSSRKNFNLLVRLFETIGFHCRERFYAGREAGWGAQVMENPRARLVLFLDVDLTPEEIEMDISHLQLPELESLGTIGLWCGLHGDSILQGGMHHLEAQFMFEELKKDLSSAGVGMMKPFSSFSYLKQAFTEGEYWPVDPKRIEILVNSKRITPEEAAKFASKGAIGSHLENLQRREGFKGFNQRNVSQIIKETDPRKQQL